VLHAHAHVAVELPVLAIITNILSIVTELNSNFDSNVYFIKRDRTKRLWNNRQKYGLCEASKLLWSDQITPYYTAYLCIGALQQHGHAHATHSWVCLMMRLKSFCPEVDKSWRVTDRMPKINKKSPINDFKTKMISWTSKNRI
jgi:hypothetical protein